MMMGMATSLFRVHVVALMALCLFSAPFASANQQTSGNNISFDQMMLAPGNHTPDQLIPDSEKNRRLHPVKESGTPTGGQAISAGDIHDVLYGNGPGRQKKTAVTADQKSTLRALVGEDDTKVNARVIFNETNGTPRLIKIEGREAVKRSGPTAVQPLSEDAANNFLNANGELLKIRIPEEEFLLTQTWTDHLGSHHLRYQQHYEGIPIWGREVVVHMDGGNEVYMLQGTYEPTPQNSQKAYTIDEQQAVAAAFEHLGLSSADPDTVHSIETVWYCPPGGRPVAAYAIDVQPKLDQRWIYFIDTDSGEVLHRINQVNSAIITANAPDLNGQIRTFTAWEKPDTGEQVMANPTIPLDDPPHEPLPTRATGDTYLYDADNRDQIDDNPLFSGPQWDPTAVSMAHHIGIIDAYWKQTFERHGMDGQSRNNMLIGHMGGDHLAFYNGTYIAFSDGDNTMFSNLAASLDVAAHEYAHGVIRHTACLIGENQSGALNEAFADIFACMVDRDDWTIGEDVVVVAPLYLRSLVDPSTGLNPLPTKMSEYVNSPNTEAGDWGGIHTNCSIPSRAAYLLAEGLSALNLGVSIGRERTEQIFYRALSVYLTQYSQFVDAREATIQAAQDLYGAEAAGSVQSAWDVVEVFSGQSPNNPAPTDPVSGEDMMVYLRRIEGNEGYHVYTQSIPKTFQGYDPALITGPLNNGIPASHMRPSAVTVNGTTTIFYVGTDQNLYAVRPDGTEIQVSDDGQIFSMAISPNAKYLAYTRPGGADNHVYVLDLVAETETSYQLISPTTADGTSEGHNTIRYANSLAFDYTGSTLVFDAYNQVQVDGEEGQYSFWSIGCLDLNSGEFYWPFPSQNPNFDVGNASFASNNRFVIAVDIIDHSTAPATSMVWNLDLENQTVHNVGTPNPSGHPFENNVTGVPSFWGDDAAVTMLIYNSNGAGLAHKVPLDILEGVMDQAVLLNGHSMAKPMMHRAGARQLNAELNADKEACAFDNGGASQQVVLSNNGNRDIRIYNIGISGPGETSYRHDGVNSLLPRDQQKTINIMFEPAPGARGIQAATLVVQSDADRPMLEISLTGNANSDGISGNDSGGGCFLSAIAP